jgi:hypothetical protein
MTSKINYSENLNFKWPLPLFSASSIKRPSSSLNKSNHRHDTENNFINRTSAFNKKNDEH